METAQIDGYVNGSLDIWNNGFSTGGHPREYVDNSQEKENVKFDMTWQMNNTLSFKFGVDAIQHNNSIKSYSIRDSSRYDSEYTPIIYTNSASFYSDKYNINSQEYSGYIQVKMEFDENKNKMEDLRSKINDIGFEISDGEIKIRELGE